VAAHEVAAPAEDISNRIMTVNYYLLGSQAEAGLLEQTVSMGVWTIFDATGESSQEVHAFFVAETPEEEAARMLMFSQASQELMLLGATLNVVNLLRK
jgi:hypothetical protein